MTNFFQQFLPEELEVDVQDFQLIKEAFALNVDEFISAHDVLFRKYDIDKRYDKTAKKYTCDKMPWKIKDLEGLTEGLAQKKFIRFPHSTYMKMRRHVTPGNYFFATWNYQLGKHRVGAQGGYGYEQHTVDFVERDLRKLIQAVVDAYNKEPTEGSDWHDRPDVIKFEAVPVRKEWISGRFLGMRVIGSVVSEMGYEMLIIESTKPIKLERDLPDDVYYGDPF